MKVIEIQISCGSFHVTKYYTSFGFFPTIKKLKTILNGTKQEEIWIWLTDLPAPDLNQALLVTLIATP